ncbi:hypothetical protein U9M48_039961, partial [Paspalum notatum var. saurae]
MAGLSTGAGPPVINVYHEKSMILPDVSRVLACLYEKNVKFETIKASYKDILSLQASRSVPVPFYDGPLFLQGTAASLLRILVVLIYNPHAMILREAWLQYICYAMQVKHAHARMI